MISYYKEDYTQWPGEKPEDFEVRREYPPSAFYFSVNFSTSSGITDTSFQEVSGISTEMTLGEEVTEGGNPYALKLPTKLTHGNLVLKRGIADKSSPLMNWCSKTLESNFSEPIKPQLINVILMNAEGSAIRTWEFHRAFPVKWSIDPFNSTKNEVAIETIELSYATSSRTK